MWPPAPPLTLVPTITCTEINFNLSQLKLEITWIGARIKATMFTLHANWITIVVVALLGPLLR